MTTADLRSRLRDMGIEPPPDATENEMRELLEAVKPSQVQLGESWDQATAPRTEDS